MPSPRIARIGALAYAAALVLAAGSARALPLFSRELNASCASCHSAAPALNARGIEFLQHGYRFADGPTPLISAHSVPLSLIATAASGEARLDVGRPGIASDTPPLRRRSFELRSAGLLAPRITYGASASYARDEVLGGDAFVQLDDVLAHGALNVRAGRFDAALPFLAPERRLTLASYLTPVDFDARGLELNGEGKAWAYAAGVSMSRRDSVGGADPRAIPSPLEDSYLTLQHRVGAHWIGAQMLFDRQNSDVPTLSWVQRLRGIVSTTIGGPRLMLTPAYAIERFDDRPRAGMHERHQYMMLESFAPIDGGHFEITGRYEHEYRTHNQILPEEHHQLAALDLAWRATPASRVALEWSHADDRLAERRLDELDALIQAGW
jgi:hypothetical protein